MIKQTRMMMRGAGRACATLLLAVLAACPGGGGGGDDTVTPDNKVVRVDVTAPAASAEAGAPMQFTATARNAAGAAVSGTFAWTSSNTAVASIGAGGQVQALAPGSTTITATESGSGVAGTAALTVVPAAVQTVTVEPASQSVVVGRTQAFTATLRDVRGAVLTGRTVVWSTANPAAATVSAQGVVTGVAPSPPIAITATAEGRSGSALLSVTPVPVSTLSFNPAGPFTLTQGGSMSLGVVARDADGNVLTGRPLTLTSSNPGVVSVSGGFVTAVSVGGPVTLTATAEGVSATTQVTVIPVAVASVTISPQSTAILQGGTQAYTATARDANGNALTGRAVAWSSASPSIATITPGGVATGVAAGSTSIIATVEGRTASATLVVAARTATSVVVNPRFTVVNVGQTANVAVVAMDAGGVAIPSPVTTWSSASTAVATVTGTGQVRGEGAGVTRVAARVNNASDTSFTAVLAPNSMLSTAFAGGQVRADIRAGTVITVPVTLDMSRVSGNGDLGAVQFEFRFDPTLLEYQSAHTGLNGSAETHSPTPGTVRFAFAGTAPQGSSNLTLATLSFRVLPGVAAGRYSTVVLEYTAAPASTSFQSYGMPVAVWGRLNVVAP